MRRGLTFSAVLVHAQVIKTRMQADKTGRYSGLLVSGDETGCSDVCYDNMSQKLGRVDRT
jgi:hypothetical protein